MKITSILKSFHPQTFESILKIELMIPVTVLRDDAASVTETEFAQILGLDLLRQIKIGIAQINQGNPA